METGERPKFHKKPLNDFNIRKSSTYPSCGRRSFIGVRSINVLDVVICKVLLTGPDSDVKWPFLHRAWHRDASWVQGCSQLLVTLVSCVSFSFPWRRCVSGWESNLYTHLFFLLERVLLVFIIIIIRWLNKMLCRTHKHYNCLNVIIT